MNSEPVVLAGTAASIIIALITWLRLSGWLSASDDQVNAFMDFVKLILPIAIPAIMALWARQKVTPVSDPRAHNLQGQLVDLVPEDGSRLAERKR